MAMISSARSNGEVARVKEKKPPTNLIEFLADEGLDDWPLPISLEGPLNIQPEGLIIGTQEDIADILKEAIPLGLDLLEEMETQLSFLENRLNIYVNQIVTDGKRPSGLTERLFYSPPKKISDDSRAVETDRRTKNDKSDLLHDLMDSIVETRGRSLDSYQFPGFVHGDFIKLPGQLEALLILQHITSVQSFSPGFKKFWQKIFLSEASSAVLQDTFWWIFLDKYNKKADFEEDREYLFDRIADSYMALFTSINTNVRDKFLSVYPDCLAQALYYTYLEAFSDSKWNFQEDFKQYLVNLIFEWVTGLHPELGMWRSWNEEALQLSKPPRDNKAAVKKMVEAGGEFNLDMDALTRAVNRLGLDAGVLPAGQNLRETSNHLLRKEHISKQESHQIGPGPEYERVKFNISGRSPLIAHYFHTRQLQSLKQAGMKVKRTEMSKLPSEGPTYQQFISSTLRNAKSVRMGYSRIQDRITADIFDLKKRQYVKNQDFSELKKALTTARNTQDRQIVMERIMKYMDSPE